MKRVYLDQNKWIDLAAAAKGVDKGRRYRDVLTLATAGVERGRASFPLSCIHYIEIAFRRWDTRQELARTMAALSRYHTIAPFSVLVHPEIDRALRAILGKPEIPREARVFGVGVGHAFNQEVRAFRVPDDLDVDSEYRGTFNRFAAEQTEWAMLAGLPPESGIDETALDAAQREVGERLAREQEQSRMKRRDANWHKGERAERLSKVTALTNWKDEIEEALTRARLNWGQLLALGRERLSAFVEAIPIIHVASELERHRCAATDKPWEPNDINDVFFLIPALVYCDVVVTERQWVDLARRSELDKRYGTVLLSDLADLGPHLV